MQLSECATSECVCNHLCNRSLQLLHTYIHKSLVNMLQHVSTVWHRFLTHHCKVSEGAEFCTICCLYLRYHGTVPWWKLLARRSAALVSISWNHDETGKIRLGVIPTGFSLCVQTLSLEGPRGQENGARLCVCYRPPDCQEGEHGRVGWKMIKGSKKTTTICIYIYI